MTDTLRELAIVLGRIVSILPLVLVMTLFMGRRSIGELPVFDFLTIITLSAVVGADIADPKIEHLHTAFAIVVIALFSRFTAYLKIRHRKLGRAITFEPVVVIQDGQFVVKNIKRIRYSLDNILSLLREKDIFDINEVHLGIIEGSGNLSILKKGAASSVTRKDLGISDQSVTIGFPVVVEGTLYESVLLDFSLTEEWLRNQLVNRGINRLDDIFFASIDTNKNIHITMKQQSLSTPSIYH
ncbi:DUF421 domain-containing protein [Bacillus salitolerans]|uniref:DUF421 domain-containing protein n=1 Tax=Bacillus salitolerans TaxID=1437434 RepID=A0ABW4LJM2_9BACI